MTPKFPTQAEIELENSSCITAFNLNILIHNEFHLIDSNLKCIENVFFEINRRWISNLNNRKNTFIKYVECIDFT